jgi:putative RNA 2'-phosphotransferase
LIETSSKRRHELRGGRIRALYGHSLPDKLKKTPGEPPEILFHGTAPAFMPAIRDGGLLPMRRQYVHLSVEQTMAGEVGRRKAKSPLILRIAAREAHASGVIFYEGNSQVWLADAVPPRFIQFP